MHVMFQHVKILAFKCDYCEYCAITKNCDPIEIYKIEFDIKSSDTHLENGQKANGILSRNDNLLDQ